MRLVQNVYGLLQVVLRRFLSHIGLLMAIAAGFVVAVAIVTSIPIYAEAVGYRILRDELSTNDKGANRPPFAFMYRYIGSQSGSLEWNKFKILDDAIDTRVIGTVGLPPELVVRYASTDKVRTLPSSGQGEPLFWANLAFASELQPHIEMVDGTFPKPTGATGPVEVLIAERKANEQGLQVGEEYLILGPPDEREPKIQLPVRIAGIWKAINPSDPFWFYAPESFDDSLLMDEQSFTTRVASATEKPVYTSLWYIIFNGEQIRSTDVPWLTGNIQRSLTAAAELLPGVALSLSPTQALVAHQAKVRLLTILLTIFALPLLGLVGYFIILVSGMVVQQQQNEIAVLRSRGTSRFQVFSIYLFETLILAGAATLLGPFLGAQAARLMTWTSAFLTFAPRTGMPIEISAAVWERAVQVAGLMLLASVVPAMIATRYTIVSYKQERARSTRPPLWQRLFLDILLLVPVYYGYNQLQNQGTIALPGVPGGDPFQNPLLLLEPTIYVFALALVSLRIFPLAMRALAWFCSLLPGTAVLMAIRYLARTTRGYTGPIMLLIITMSLATFTSSMSLTLDKQLFDRALYQSGADLRMIDLGEDTKPPAGLGQPSAAAPPDAGQGNKVDEARWLFVPVTDYLSIPGVQAATRVGRSEVEAQFNNKLETGIFLGIDRADLGGVVGTGFRPDYARDSLGSMLNLLADDQASVLVSRDYAIRHGLRIGDKISIAMNDTGATHDVPFVVVGTMSLFPTLYTDQPFFIGNLDYAFDQQGGQYPYEVWAKLTPDGNPQQILDETGLRGLRVLRQEYAPALIMTELLRPERQGVFGLLSIGFLASAFLTVLGFLFYSVLSFRRRFVELGMLRAIGLSVSQMAALLTCEQGLIIGLGMGIGTLLGISASSLFIPFLQVRTGQHPNTPPFIVQIAWSQIGIIYAIFGGMLVLAIVITLVLLARMRVFQAVKLGEAV